MNNQKNYKKGTRKELIYILTSTGLITLNSLHIIAPEFNYNTFRLKLEEMAREKIVKKKRYKTSNEQITYYTFADYRINKNLFMQYIPSACIEYYENEKDNIRRVNNETNSARVLRKIQEAEIMLFMYISGFASFADQIKGTRYFNSKEIKRYLNYGDDIEKETDTVLYTKVHGFISNEFNNYSVYHIYKKIPALSSGEMKIINIFKMFIKKQYPSVNKAILKGIMLAKKIELLIPYINIEEKDKEKNELIITSYLDKYPNGLYLIPYDNYGKQHIRIMSMPEWDKRIISVYLDHKPNTSGVDIACDDYDKENKIYTLVFCVPDLNKLKNFYYNAKMINKPEHFRIICFDYQYEFIKSLFEEIAEIYEAAFEKYYEKIKEEM